MTPERFAALADAYGADLNRWPAAEREAARTLSSGSERAKAVLAAAAGLDALLARWVVEKPSPALSVCIAAAVTSRRVRARRLRLWFSGAGAAAALACGVAAGASFVALSAPSPDQQVGRLYQLSVLGAPLEDQAPLGSNGRL